MLRGIATSFLALALLTPLVGGAQTKIDLGTQVKGHLPAANGGAGTVNGILKANGSGTVSGAASGTDYAPATSGTNILYGNGSGGFSNVTVGSGLTFSAGTLSASGGGGSPGGSSGSLQYNDGGSFGGDGSLTFDSSTKAVSADHIVLTSTGYHTSGTPAITLADGIYLGSFFGGDLFLQLTGTTAFYVGREGSIAISINPSITNPTIGLVNVGIAQTDTAGLMSVNNGQGNYATYRDLQLRSLVATEIIATSGPAPTVASASTIAPTTSISFVSGTTSISTITPPSFIASGGGQITLIPTGLLVTDTSGNIALATTGVVGRALTMTYDSATAKWYPSY